ncbi:MAG: helical backbone metal receptor, partial [Planctomycetota bacterium]
MRIVSLCPSLTELVFALGRGNDLVGITRYCVHPEEGVRGVERVGGTKNPRNARIIQLAPDLVLLNEEENRLEDARELEQAGLDCLSTFPKSAGETAGMVRLIARALRREEAGERIAREIEERNLAAREARGEEVSFAYLIWKNPWMSVNGDTYTSSLLVEAGGRNVFNAEEVRYPRVTPEDLRLKDPELVMLSSEPYHFTDEHRGELQELTGLPLERFRLVDGEY